MAVEELHRILLGNLSRVKSNELSDTENKGKNTSLKKKALHKLKSPNSQEND